MNRFYSVYPPYTAAQRTVWSAVKLSGTTAAVTDSCDSRIRSTFVAAQTAASCRQHRRVRGWRQIFEKLYKINHQFCIILPAEKKSVKEALA